MPRAVLITYGTVHLKSGNKFPLHQYRVGGNAFWLENRNLCYTWLVAGKQKDKNLRGLRVLVMCSCIPEVLLSCDGSVGLLTRSRLWKTGSVPLHLHVKWEMVQRQLVIGSAWDPCEVLLESVQWSSVNTIMSSLFVHGCFILLMSLEHINRALTQPDVTLLCWTQANSHPKSAWPH